MQEKIKAIEEYLKFFPNDRTAKNNLTLCNYCEELGLELPGKWQAYPNIYNEKTIKINSKLEASKSYYLTNKTTNYEHNNVDTVVIWDTGCGRLEYVNSDYWYDIENEWQEFMDVLKSYEPLDYDEVNNRYVYSLENGKRLIEAYDELEEAFKDKLNRKIKAVQLAQKKKQMELLQKEISEME